MSQMQLEMEPKVAWALLYPDGSCDGDRGEYWPSYPAEQIAKMKELELSPVAVITIRLKGDRVFEDSSS